MSGTQTKGVAQRPYRPEEDFLSPPITITVSPAKPQAGVPVTFTCTLANTTRITLRNVVLYLTGEGGGKAFRLGNLAPGAQATRSWTTTPDATAEGLIDFTAHTIFDVHAHGSDSSRVTSSVRLPNRSLASAFDNAGIASDDNLAGVDFDGSKSSLSAQALAAAGLTPGAKVTYDGVTFTWPNTEPGKFDNVIASGQTILQSGSGSRLAFLGTSTWGEGKGEGRVIYADGTEQPFSVTVPDWYGAIASAVLVLPYRHNSTGRDDNPVSLFLFDVVLRQGAAVHSIVLPNVSAGLQPSVAALHIFAMTIA